LKCDNCGSDKLEETGAVFHHFKCMGCGKHWTAQELVTRRILVVKKIVGNKEVEIFGEEKIKALESYLRNGKLTKGAS